MLAVVTLNACDHWGCSSCWRPGVGGCGGPPFLSHGTDAALAFPVFLQREAKKAFCWSEEDSDPGALQKAYSFFKVTGILLSVFNLDYLNRGRRVVMLFVASSEPHQVGHSVLEMLLPGSFLALLFAFGFQKVWISCGDVALYWSFSCVSWDQWVQRAFPVLVSILVFDRCCCCANFKHSSVLIYRWQAALCCVITQFDTQP